MIGDDAKANAHHISARCATLLILQGAAAQPVIQCWLTAVEFGEIVIGAKLLRSSKRLPAHRSHGAVVRNSRRSRGFAAGGRSSIAVKRLKSSAGREK